MSVTTPASERAASNPTTTPPCAARPRSPAPASAAEHAISPCVIAVPSSPTATIPASSATRVDEAATPMQAAVSSRSCTVIRRLRFSRSPSGTTNSSASAQPSCVAVMTPPTAACDTPKSRAIESSSGCA